MIAIIIHIGTVWALFSTYPTYAEADDDAKHLRETGDGSARVMPIEEAQQLIERSEAEAAHFWAVARGEAKEARCR